MRRLGPDFGAVIVSLEESLGEEKEELRHKVRVLKRNSTAVYGRRGKKRLKNQLWFKLLTKERRAHLQEGYRKKPGTPALRWH